MRTSLAVFGVSITEEKAEEFTGSRHYSIATDTVSVYTVRAVGMGLPSFLHSSM
jgi:hypothetical protein